MSRNNAVYVGLLPLHRLALALGVLPLVVVGLGVVAVGVVHGQDGAHVVQHLNLGVGVGLPGTSREGVETRVDCRGLLLLLQAVPSGLGDGYWLGVRIW